MVTKNTAKVIEILKEHGPISKSDAEQYGMANTTFYNNVAPLVEDGLVERIKGAAVGKGRPKILYKIKGE